MIVRVLAIEPSSLPGAHDAAMTYDVTAEIDAEIITFRTSVILTQIGHHVLQSAGFCDDLYKEVFRWHHTILTKMGNLVLAHYNGDAPILPVRLDET